ncbi:TonB-dependent receptor plug domain-containing protein [Aliarcobacter lanthieri]|uniref:TonB-dependent receptor plug domain-containing protein n=1 Tax=Aliarcobacter lanthieri TaxID=1355374 RepID=UPI003AAD2B00
MTKKLSFVLATTLFSCTLLASETTYLGEVNIIAGDNSDSKFKSNQISSEDMQLQEKNTVVDALNTISGINVYNLGGRNEKMITVRGFDPKHSPLYIDGIPIAVAYDGYVDFSRFTTFDLDKIQVSKGLTSTLLGVNTFAGAINLVTKKPTKEFEGTISAGAFSGDGKKGYINLGTNQGKYYIQASGSYMDRNYYPMSNDFQKTTFTNQGITTHQDNNRRVNSYAEDKNINLKVGYTPNDTDEYAINYINQKADKGVPYTTKPTISNNKDDRRFWEWDYWDKESIYFLSNTNFKYGYIKSRIFYDKFKNQLSTYTDNTYSIPDSNFAGWYDDNTKGISLEIGQYDTERNSLKLALHAKKDSHKENDGGTNKVYNMQINTYSIGLEDTFKVTDDFRIITGASWDKDDVKQADNTRYNPNNGNILSQIKEFENTSSDSFNPMVKVEYDIDETFGFYAGIAKKSRFASIKDRYSYRRNGAIPNPDLKPEKAINYEIGANKIFDNQGIKSAFFYSDVKDFITMDRVQNPNGNGLVDQNKNIGKVKHMGYELEYFYSFDETLDFDASYTRLLAEDKDNKVDITNVPKHKIALGVTYRPIKGLTTNVNMQYSSSRHTSTNDRSRDISGAAIWNAKIAYELVKGLTLDVGASNIFDKNYEYDYGYPEAGRVIYSNLTYKF